MTQKLLHSAAQRVLVFISLVAMAYPFMSEAHKSACVSGGKDWCINAPETLSLTWGHPAAPQKQPEQDHPSAPASRYWTLTGYDTAYKNAILKDFQDMLYKAAVPHGEQAWYVAQLALENGAFTVDRLGDHGCSFGLMQYNACIHNGMSARRFLLLHPEWLKVKTQLAWMLDEIKQRRATYGTIRLRIIAHNQPACAARHCFDTDAGYYSKVAKIAATLTSL